MSTLPTPVLLPELPVASVRPQIRVRKPVPLPVPVHFSAQPSHDDAPRRHAELFYLQKQIQSQTRMIIVLEDGEQIDGCIEWYDRNALKIRGQNRTLVYKSAIKYMYKHGDPGQ
jgi:sRNA-binding regulator protein Hfq